MRIPPFIKLLVQAGKRHWRHARIARRHPDLIAWQAGMDSAAIDPALVFLESFHGAKATCNPYAIYRELQARKGHELRFVWSLSSRARPPADIATAPNVTIVRPRGREYAQALLSARHVVTNSTLPDYAFRRDGQDWWNTWHGIPLKAMGRDAERRLGVLANVQRNFLQASGLPLAGEYAAGAILDPYFASPLTRPKARLVGSPRIDLTLKADAASLRARLGASPGQPVILYAPTWRGRMGSISADLSALVTACEAIRAARPEALLVVSLHNFVRKALRQERQAHGLRLLADDVDINEALAAVDILISDYSSIIPDFLILDRPVIAHVPDIAEYRASRGLYLDPEALPLTLAATPQALAQALADPRKPSQFACHAGVMARLLPHEDGHAAARAVDLMFAPPAAPAPASGRQRLFIHAGGLRNNGISASLMNLLDNLDPARFEPYVFIDAGLVDREPDHWPIYHRLPAAADRLFHIGARARVFTAAEMAILAALRVQGRLAERDRPILTAAFRREVRRQFGDAQFDIAIDFSGYSEFSAFLTAAVPARRHVLFQHNDLWAEATNPHPSRNMRSLRASFAAYRHFDTLASVSAQVMASNQASLAAHATPGARFLTLRNSLSLPLIRQMARAPLPGHLRGRIMPGVPVFASIGRLSPEKNHARLLTAFHQLLSTGARAQLWLVGDGPLRGALAGQARALGLGPHVIFTGLLENPFAAMAQADCIVQASDYEGQPMVLLEALSLGKPCIATDNPGNRSVLGEGQGVLVPMSAEGLCQAMAAFLDHPPSPPSFDAEAYVAGVMAEFTQAICEASP